MCEENMLNTYTVPLLRNFEIKYLKPLLQSTFDDFNKEFNDLSGDNSWIKISDYLNDNINDGFDDTQLEQELFEKLVFELPDHMYILPLDSEIDANEFMERHSDSVEMNRKISTIMHSEDKLVTIRQVENKVIFLYRSGTADVGRGTKASLYIPCIIDFENSFVFIKTRKHYVKCSETNIQEIINFITEDINENLDFDISIGEFNSATIHEVIYKLFSDEASKAEKIIKEHMNDFTETELVDKIKLFLSDDLNINDPDNYIDRVKSAFFQDLSLQLDNSEFNGGYIFAFTFFDREFTKSATRSSLREPIYNKKIYWNLKDLIHDYKELTELSLYWKFDKDNFAVVPEGENFSFVEVSIREKNGCLEIHFYNTKEERRVKEEYVIFKIREYLWGEEIP